MTLTATVRDAESTSGAVLAPYTWSFTTSGLCPCSLFETTTRPAIEDTGDTDAVELGVRVTPTEPGAITGVRFFRRRGGPGHLQRDAVVERRRRAATGQVTVDASGWQIVQFAEPVQVLPGQVYTASYLAHSGRYPVTRYAFSGPVTNGPLAAAAGSNGVYVYGGGFPTQPAPVASSDYLVDVSFVPGEPVSDGPDITAVDPVEGAGTVPVGASITVSMSEPVSVDQVSVSLSRGGAAVAGSLAQVDAQTVRFAPDQLPSHSATYQVDASASPAAGQPASGQRTWSFATGAPPSTPGVCPCGLWDDTAVPATVSADDPGPVELGTTFAVEVAGSVRGCGSTRVRGTPVPTWGPCGRRAARRWRRRRSLTSRRRAGSR